MKQACGTSCAHPGRLRTADGHALCRDLGQLELVDAVLVTVVAHLGQQEDRAHNTCVRHIGPLPPHTVVTTTLALPLAPPARLEALVHERGGLLLAHVRPVLLLHQRPRQVVAKPFGQADGCTAGGWQGWAREDCKVQPSAFKGMTDLAPSACCRRCRCCYCQGASDSNQAASVP